MQIQESFRSAQSELEIPEGEACETDPSLAADNQRLLAVANGIVTFYDRGLFEAQAALERGQTTQIGNRVATAASALSVVQRQISPMEESHPQAASHVATIHESLKLALRSTLTEASDHVYCSGSIDRCEGMVGHHLMAGSLFAEAAHIGGMSGLASQFEQNATQMGEDHESLVREAFERFSGADRIASDATRSHLVKIGDRSWLLNPLRYGLFMSSMEEASQDLRESEDDFQSLGDGAMVNATQTRLAEVQGDVANAQQTFFIASLVYLALFGLLLYHLVRTTMQYRREVEAAELGFRLLDHCSDLLGVRDVDIEGERLRVEFLRDCFEAFGVDVGQREVGARVGAVLRTPLADPGCRARDQNHVVIESEAVEHAHTLYSSESRMLVSPHMRWTLSIVPAILNRRQP
jgi:hypothetical protein